MKKSWYNRRTEMTAHSSKKERKISLSILTCVRVCSTTNIVKAKSREMKRKFYIMYWLFGSIFYWNLFDIVFKWWMTLILSNNNKFRLIASMNNVCMTKYYIEIHLWPKHRQNQNYDYNFFLIINLSNLVYLYRITLHRIYQPIIPNFAKLFFFNLCFCCTRQFECNRRKKLQDKKNR